MKVLLLLGLEVQSSSFMYNRVFQYCKNGLDFDIYQPFITRNKDEYEKANESFNIKEFGNINKIVYTPKGMRIDDKQLCFSMYEVMINAVKNKKYDLIQAHWVYPHGYVAYLLSKKLNIPFIVTAHGSDVHTTPYLYQDTEKYKEIRRFTIEAINKANAVVFVSNYLKNEAKKLNAFNKNNTVIYNGVDCELFKIIDKVKYRETLNFSLNKKYILYAGNLEYIKGSDYLIPIYKEVLKKDKNVEMIIIGNGEMKYEMLNKIKCENLSNNIHCINHIPQDKLSIYMGISDVLILPSRNEAWGCVINEALACGIPVVGSSIKGIEEAIGGVQYGSLVDHTSKNFINIYSKEIINWLIKKYDSLKLREKVLNYTWKKQCKLEIEFMKKVFNN